MEIICVAAVEIASKVFSHQAKTAVEQGEMSISAALNSFFLHFSSQLLPPDLQGLEGLQGLDNHVTAAQDTPLLSSIQVRDIAKKGQLKTITASGAPSLQEKA